MECSSWGKRLSLPILLYTKEREEIESDVEGVVRGMEAMRAVRENLAELFPEQGIVRLDRYEEALDALAQMKGQVIDEFAGNEQEREIWNKMWLFES